jgi:chromosome segregation ATPase
MSTLDTNLKMLTSLLMGGGPFNPNDQRIAQRRLELLKADIAELRKVETQVEALRTEISTYRSLISDLESQVKREKTKNESLDKELARLKAKPTKKTTVQEVGDETAS